MICDYGSCPACDGSGPGPCHWPKGGVMTADPDCPWGYACDRPAWADPIGTPLTAPCEVCLGPKIPA